MQFRSLWTKFRENVCKGLPRHCCKFENKKFMSSQSSIIFSSQVFYSERPCIWCVALSDRHIKSREAPIMLTLTCSSILFLWIIVTHLKLSVFTERQHTNKYYIQLYDISSSPKQQLPDGIANNNGLSFVNCEFFQKGPLAHGEDADRLFQRLTRPPMAASLVLETLLHNRCDHTC